MHATPAAMTRTHGWVWLYGVVQSAKSSSILVCEELEKLPGSSASIEVTPGPWDQNVMLHAFLDSSFTHEAMRLY